MLLRREGVTFPGVTADLIGTVMCLLFSHMMPADTELDLACLEERPMLPVMTYP